MSGQVLACVLSLSRSLEMCMPHGACAYSVWFDGIDASETMYWLASLYGSSD